MALNLCINLLPTGKHQKMYKEEVIAFFILFIMLLLFVDVVGFDECFSTSALVMPRTQPLCAGAELNLGDRGLGEVEKKSFIALPGKGGHSGLLPFKGCVFQPGRIW